MSVIASLLPDLNSILGVRDQVGAALKPVEIVTWTWSGREIGDGDKVVTKVPVTPSPRIVEFAADSRVLQGGAVKAGDIMLKMISKATFPTLVQVDGSVPSRKVEKFYDVGGVQYQVIGVTEKHLTWNVHLRRRSSQG